jgi:hypothetical protein
MVGILLTFAAAVVAAAGVVFLAARRRRARSPSLSPRLDPMPAGVKHLAASVGDLSDLGLRLPAATRALGRKHRLGVLLGLR